MDEKIEPTDSQIDKQAMNDKKLRAKQIIGQLYNQLTKGCGKEFCTNKDCASNKIVWKDRKLSEKEALKLAIQLTKSINSTTNCSFKFCTPGIKPKTIQVEEFDAIETYTEEQLSSRYNEVFSCPFSLSFSFLMDRENYLEVENHNIDFEAVEKYYSIIERTFKEERSVDLFVEAANKFYKNLKEDDRNIEEPWIFRSLFIILQNPCLFNPLCQDIIDIFSLLLIELYTKFKVHRSRVEEWVSQFSSNRILDHIQKIQSAMMIQILNRTFLTERKNDNDEGHCLFYHIDALDIYNTANLLKPEGKRVKYNEFYNDGINKEIEIKSHYEKWAKALKYCRKNGIPYKKSKNFTLLNYPWLLDTSSKGEIMKYESTKQMNESGYLDLANMFIMGFSDPSMNANESDYLFLKFEISRDTIIEDTLNSLIREGVNLK